MKEGNFLLWFSFCGVWLCSSLLIQGGITAKKLFRFFVKALLYWVLHGKKVFAGNLFFLAMLQYCLEMATADKGFYRFDRVCNENLQV